MQYFVHGRDAPGARRVREQHTEAHWAYMDRYASTLIARGPTLTEDGEDVTGSVHLVELPGREAAQTFASNDPYHQAGVFADVLLRRWRSALGRTMWDFTGGGDDPRFLVLGHGRAPMTYVGAGPDADQRAYLAGHLPRQLIADGPLLSDDGSEWLGTVTLVELPDRAAAEAMLIRSPHGRAELYEKVEVHRWRFGGRPPGV
jgi:uncharacterized protein YciI